MAEALKGADAWLVAYASVLGGSVVTGETEVGIGAKKVKIPNLCQEFHVDIKTLWEMLDALDVTFV